MTIIALPGRGRYRGPIIELQPLAGRVGQFQALFADGSVDHVEGGIILIEAVPA